MKHKINLPLGLKERPGLDWGEAGLRKGDGYTRRDGIAGRDQKASGRGRKKKGFFKAKQECAGQRGTGMEDPQSTGGGAGDEAQGVLGRRGQRRHWEAHSRQGVPASRAAAWVDRRPGKGI